MSDPRILVLNLTRFGDLLQTSPSIAGLRERYPEAAITLVAERNFADVCDGIPGITRVYRLDLDRLGGRVLEGGGALLEAYRSVEQVVDELRAERFDVALNYSSSRMTAVFMGLLGVRDSRGWTMTPDGLRVIRDPWARLFATMCLNRRLATFNLVDYYRAMAGGGGETRRLLYDVSGDAQRAADGLLADAGAQPGERLVALQLGASRASRQWPTEAFVALGTRLARAGCRVVLVGGGGDRPLAATVAAGIGARVIDACGRTSIGELGGLLTRAAVLVTGDTGPMHMAVAVGTPVVGLFFGPASPFDTGPYGADHVLVQTEAACAPCNHTVTCLNPFCRVDITPELVDGLVQARLGGDWRRIERLARAEERARVYRTGFDALGWHRCELLGGRAPRAEDTLRAAYRATFQAELLGAPLPEEGASGIDPAPFVGLGRIARDGVALAMRLLDAARARQPSLAEIERLGRAIETLDQALVAHGHTHDDAGVLTQMFRFGKENLEGDDVAALAGETGLLYRALAVEADVMATLLGGDARQEEALHARLHQ